jgi:hypothetical protein
MAVPGRSPLPPLYFLAEIVPASVDAPALIVSSQKCYTKSGRPWRLSGQGSMGGGSTPIPHQSLIKGFQRKPGPGAPKSKQRVLYKVGNRRTCCPCPRTGAWSRGKALIVDPVCWLPCYISSTREEIVRKLDPGRRVLS